MSPFKRGKASETNKLRKDPRKDTNKGDSDGKTGKSTSTREQPDHWMNWTDEQYTELAKASDRMMEEGAKLTQSQPEARGKGRE